MICARSGGGVGGSRDRKNSDARSDGTPGVRSDGAVGARWELTHDLELRTWAHPVNYGLPFWAILQTRTCHIYIYIYIYMSASEKTGPVSNLQLLFYIAYDRFADSLLQKVGSQ